MAAEPASHTKLKYTSQLVINRYDQHGLRMTSTRTIAKRVLTNKALAVPLSRWHHWRGMHSSNREKWSRRHKGVTSPSPFHDTLTYRIGADFLSGCSLVEDWGCGLGWMRTLVTGEGYRGVDGTATQFSDVVADLTDYRSCVPGLFMRHVLEHNYRWAEILDNALASFTERMVLVTFIPFSESTHEIAYNWSCGVPDISFRLSDLTDHFGSEVQWTMETLETKSQYNTETIFFLSR
jgi:hypothetical protein